MRKRIVFFISVIVLLCGAAAHAAGYPALPENGRAHYIIYNDGNRGDRIELAAFDTTLDEVINWGRDMSLVVSGEYANDIKYYLDDGSWVEFERGYERISDYATGVIESDIDVKDYKNKIRLYGQSADGTLKSLPGIKKDWNELTAGTVLYGDVDGKTRIFSAALSNSSGEALQTAEIGHFIDIEGDIYPDRQKCFKTPEGYAIVPFFHNDGFLKTENKGTREERIEYDPEQYNKIYFTDEEYQLQYTASADFADYGSDRNYIVAVAGVITVNDRCFALMQRVRVDGADDHDEYSLNSDYVCLIDGRTICIPPLAAASLPYAVNENVAVLQLSQDSHESELAFIGGGIYTIMGEVTERGRDFCCLADDFFVKTNISSAAEVTGGEADNHRVGLIDTLYFSKDYINFVSVPLIKKVPDTGFSCAYFCEFDDQYYMYASFKMSADSDSGMDIQIISKERVYELMEEQLPADPVYVAYKDMLFSFETPPRIVDGRTLIPLRFLFETMGAEVVWDEDSETASITQNGRDVSVTIGSTEARVNGQRVMLDVPVQLIGGRVMVPLRFLSESLGYTVEWNDAARLAVIE